MESDTLSPACKAGNITLDCILLLSAQCMGWHVFFAGVAEQYFKQEQQQCTPGKAAETKH
jgi:hypothetical protein